MKGRRPTRRPSEESPAGRESTSCSWPLCSDLTSDLHPRRRCSPQENQEEGEEEPGPGEPFWDTPCAFSPESRLEAHRRLEKSRKSAET